MSQRVKGMEVKLSFTHPQGKQEELEDVVSFEAELDIEMLREAYLGKTGDDFDDIYHGVTGSVELHMQSDAWFRFTERVEDRARRRRAAGGVFTVTASFAFPNGQRPRLTFENIFFGPLPIRAPTQKDYVQATISWGGNTIRRVL